MHFMEVWRVASVGSDGGRTHAIPWPATIASSQAVAIVIPGATPAISAAASIRNRAVCTAEPQAHEVWYEVHHNTQTKASYLMAS
jgi:hypothetical protein